jgi:hypothetical protein
MTETDIQNNIRIALSAHGVCFRMQSGNFTTDRGMRVKIGVTGMSDLLFIGQGYIAWIEVKTPTGRIKPEQLNFISEMKKLGHRAGIVRSVNEALELIGEKI